MYSYALVLAFAFQQPPVATQPTPPAATQPKPPVATQPQPQPPATTQPRRPSTTTVTMEVHVTDGSGMPASDVQVTAVGPSMRDGTTSASGNVTFRTVVPGTYRLRAEGTNFITLEKEVTVRAGASATAEMTLSAAPPPPPPPPPPPAAAPPPPPPVSAPVGAIGKPRLLSMTDLAEKSLGGRDPVKMVPVGCTGLTNARLIVLRDSMMPTTYEDADEHLYLLAGEATLTLDDKQQTITAGWFTQVPRNTKFGVTRKGRNPVVLVSLLVGRPCTSEQADGRP
jgi:mannose-6-phosphate isomerase-like protein (cupin superfamily)